TAVKVSAPKLALLTELPGSSRTSPGATLDSAAAVVGAGCSSATVLDPKLITDALAGGGDSTTMPPVAEIYVWPVSVAAWSWKTAFPPYAAYCPSPAPVIAPTVTVAGVARPRKLVSASRYETDPSAPTWLTTVPML